VPLSGGEQAIIVPTFYPHEQDRAFLVREEDELPIQFTQLLEYTGFFSKYRFKPASEGASDAVEGQKEEDSYKGLWGEL
jgi:hypothetical protein